MNDNRNPVMDLALILTEAVDQYLKSHSEVETMQVCAALGAAAGAVVATAIPVGNDQADFIAFGLVKHGFVECLSEIRKARSN